MAAFAKSMKLHFTSRDFVLIIGILVALIIGIASLLYRDALLTTKPFGSKKIHTSNLYPKQLPLPFTVGK
jgi:hypothetical protein